MTDASPTSGSADSKWTSGTVKPTVPSDDSSAADATQGLSISRKLFSDIQALSVRVDRRSRRMNTVHGGYAAKNGKLRLGVRITRFNIQIATPLHSPGVFPLAAGSASAREHSGDLPLESPWWIRCNVCQKIPHRPPRPNKLEAVFRDSRAPVVIYTLHQARRFPQGEICKEQENKGKTWQSNYGLHEKPVRSKKECGLCLAQIPRPRQDGQSYLNPDSLTPTGTKTGGWSRLYVRVER